MDKSEHFNPEASPEVLAAIGMLNMGILVVDREGRITFANRAAEDLLHCRAGRSIHCWLREETPPGGKAPDRPLRAAISRGERGIETYLAVSTASNRPLIALIVPCGSDDKRPERASTSILFVSDPTAEVDLDLRPVARLYGLTCAETWLLRALLKGKRVGEYAKQAGITLNTAKGYLKQLFSKTRVSRQSDLMRLVLANPLLRLFSGKRGQGGKDEGGQP